MAYQIAFIWDDECEKELETMGFKKTEVYIKQAPFSLGRFSRFRKFFDLLRIIWKGSYPSLTEKQQSEGDMEFFDMARKPFQFVTTSYWGAGLE